ncbi:hypothetical protein H7F33_01580 [Pedobacter sp. PAMC26386]|nr:hypothetical protein H7F33_01580 [Pedobacter sp. PAMC26386]
MKKMIVLFFNLFTLSFCSGKDFQTRNADPEKAEVVSSDIPNFWAAFDSCKLSPQNNVAIYNSPYFDKGSPGLKLFKTAIIGTTEDFVKILEKYGLYYESIRKNTLQIAQLKPVVLKSLIRLKRLYRSAIFPDIYIEMGDLSSDGTSLTEGLFIGAEVNCADSDSNFANIHPSFVKVLKSLTLSNIPVMLSHEFVHYQQNYADSSKKMLSQAIREGSADFICKLITGLGTSELLREYGEQQEKNLWNDFKNDHYDKKVNKWFYYRATDERPTDLGTIRDLKLLNPIVFIARTKRRLLVRYLM